MCAICIVLFIMIFIPEHERIRLNIKYEQEIEKERIKSKL